jgi:hypothetical protein
MTAHRLAGPSLPCETCCEIEELRPHPFSRMPEGLLDSFDESEVLDMLAALIAGPGE